MALIKKVFGMKQTRFLAGGTPPKKSSFFCALPRDIYFFLSVCYTSENINNSTNMWTFEKG